MQEIVDARSAWGAPLAVIGMACRLPGAENLDEYWQLLESGQCAIGEAPEDRLNRRLYYDRARGALSKTYTLLGGTITYRPFDALRCPVPSRILASTDIGHQTICQVAAEACRHGRMNPFDLPHRRVGVYVGHNLGGPVAGELIYGTLVEQSAQYLREIDAFRRLADGREDELIDQLVRRIRADLPRRGSSGGPSCASHLAAAIISEALGLDGPTMILDAACSSALQGLAMACRALRLGRIDMAIVGGASYFHVDSLLLFSRAQAASASGSRPFDAEADGLVSSEGYVAVVIKRLDRALADGDPIYCVIRGIGLSSDGRGKSLWAPRKEGQVLAIRRAYEHGLDIGRLQYVEAHATSTPIGDLTELKALAEAFQGRLPPGAKIPVGAVKANIGHTLEAAGLAGLIKTVLAMQHKVIPQQIGLSQLNPGFEWDNAPLVVPTANLPWPEFADGHPRRAAVNSFGIGGLNVHVVLDEYRPPGPSLVPAGRQIPPSESRFQQEPIAIIGASCIFPGARTLDAFWDLLRCGRDPKCDVPPDRWDARIGYEPGRPTPWRSPCKRGGFITDFRYDWRRHKIPPNQVAHADPLQLMVLDSTDAALADAGYQNKPFDKTRMGVVVGTVFGDDFCQQLLMGFRLPHFCDNLAGLLRGRGVREDAIGVVSQAYCDVLLKHMPALLDETGGFTPSSLASRITKVYDWMGGAVAIDAGQASSLAAIGAAVEMLLDRSCDAVVCAAGHRAMGLPVYELLSLEGRLAADPPRTPPETNREGYLPAEGVGVLVLKRLADAQQAGDRVRGIIRGVGAGFAASHGKAVEQAVQRAHSEAGLAPRNFVLWETSGTGYPEEDNEEVAALAEFTAGELRCSPVLVGSVARQIGHTHGAAGMASLLTCMRSLEEEEAPSSFRSIGPEMNLAAQESPGRPGVAMCDLKQHSGESREMLAGVTCTDGWGAAYHLVLQRAEAAALDWTTAATPSVEIGERAAAWRIVRVGAAAMHDLKQQAAQAAEEAASRFARADSVQFRSEESCRLALVVQDLSDLQKKLRLAADQIDTPKAAVLARQGTFVGRVNPGDGKIAFIFSGQGSQYQGMLKELVAEFPPAAEAQGRIDEVLRRLQMPTFAEIAWEDRESLGTDVWITQLSLLCADTIVFQSLQALGVFPDYVAGHSYGEYPALAAAGAWDFENAVLGTRARCQAIESYGNAQGCMLSVGVAGPVVEQMCREIEGPIYPSNYNAPDQTVVGGTEEAIGRLEERLTALGIPARKLAVPRPFHTPLLHGVCEPLARGLEPIRLQTPRLPMVSSVSNRVISSPEEIRENLVAQMVTPVRYVDLIGQLADQGVRAVVEVGPRQVLTGLNHRILAGRDIPSIACDDKARPGLFGLLAVRACLESRGLAERRTAGPVANMFAVVSQLADSSRQSDLPAGPTGENPDVLVLSGAPYELGQQHGRAWADAICTIARRYADSAGMEGQGSADPLGLASGEGLPTDFQEDEREELRGLADSVGVSPMMLAAYNAQLDARDADPAAQVIIGSLAGAAQLIHGFHCGSASRPPGCDAATRQIVHLCRPAVGLAHLAVSWPGAIGAAAGLNERGLAINSMATHVDPSTVNGGSTALRSLLVRRVLHRAADVDAAVELLRKTPGRAGWELYVSHAASGRACRVHFTGAGAVVAAAPIRPLNSIDEAVSDILMKPGTGELIIRRSREDGQWGSSCYRLELSPRRMPPMPPEPSGVQEASVQPGFVPISPDEYLAVSQNVDGRPPLESGDRVCCRFALRMVRTPVPTIADAQRKLNGPALIVGDNPVAVALRRQIEQWGNFAAVLPVSDDVQKTLALVEEIWQTHRPPHLFLVTPFDHAAVAALEASTWQRRRWRGVMLPYLVCQKWFTLVSESHMVDQASVLAATAMGGDLGLSGHMDSPESGGITGLVKALCIEFGWTTNWAFRAKVVDTPRNEPPDAVAEALLRELHTGPYATETGYVGGRRYVIAGLRRSTELMPGNTPTRGRSWLITGGGRGITAAIALEMGKRFGIKLHLVGSSPRPQIDPAWRGFTPEERKKLRATLVERALAEKRLPAELWREAEKSIEIDRTLHDMEVEGLSAVYHACNLGDRQAVARLLDEIRKTDGPLEGIVHGAGFEAACRFTKKDPQLVSKTLTAKVDSAAALMDLTWRDPLRFFIAFGSISGRWGSVGQTDYALASDMLAKLIDWYRRQRPECHATCFHWQPWAEIGMAARDESRGGNMLRRLAFLPPCEGVQYFLEELLAGCPEPEVVITDWKYYKEYHPDLSQEKIAELLAGIASESEAPKEAARSPEVPAAHADQVAARHVMRMVETPLEQTSGRPFAFAGPALVLGDNADARALSVRLAQAGVQVHHLPIGSTAEATLMAPEWMSDGAPPPHLFLMSGRDPDATEFASREAWRRRRHRGVVLPFLVCQKWLALLENSELRARASLVAVTSLGGDFGFSRSIPAPEGGALTGLLKGLYLESGGKRAGGLHVKIVDAPADEPPECLAEAVLREMDIESVDVEAAWTHGRRSVVRLALAPIGSLPTEEIRRGGVWVFTGGARGITAAVAKEMGYRYGLKLHLLGKSDLPQFDPAWANFDDKQWQQLKRLLAQKAIAEGKSPGAYWDRIRRDREIDHTLRELSSAGVQATYHSCDVTDWSQLERTLERIREIDGPIEGIVHGAGIHGPALTIAETSEEMLSQMVDIKVESPLALMLLTRSDPLRHFVGFGSISGRFGTANASAYTLANDMLCKLIGWHRTRQPTCHAVGIHWHPWGEVGMMTRPVSQHTIMVMKMKMMPPAEGVEHLLGELRSGTPESEVLITDAQFYETFYSRELLLESDENRRAALRPAGALIDRIVAVEAGHRVSFDIHLDPVRDPFLREHRLRKKAILPMVLAIEAFAEAASLLAGSNRSVVAMRDLEIAEAVRLFSDEPTDVHIHAELCDSGVRCRLTSDFRNRRGQLVQKDRLHFSAVLELAERPAVLARASGEEPAEWFDVVYPSREALMYHGPPLRLLKRAAIDDSGGWGQICLPAENELAGSRNAAEWLTPSAAIDACCYACGVYTWVRTEGRVTVPARLAELRCGRPPRASEGTMVRLVCHELGQQHGVFDFTLCGEDGQTIFQVQGYRCHVLGGGKP